MQVIVDAHDLRALGGKYATASGPTRPTEQEIVRFLTTAAFMVPYLCVPTRPLSTPLLQGDDRNCQENSPLHLGEEGPRAGRGGTTRQRVRAWSPLRNVTVILKYQDRVRKSVRLSLPGSRWFIVRW